MTYFSPLADNEAPWPPSWEPSAPPTAKVPPAAASPVAPRPEGARYPLGAPAGPAFGWTAGLSNWLDDKERELTHPAIVEKELLRSGWDRSRASFEALRYRSRFNEHHLGYTALLVSTGVAALALGTAGHILASGLDHPIGRNGLAGWLTVFVVALPFAIWAHIWAARVDRDDPVAVWSQARRRLALALVWACGLVGVGRLLIYAAQLIGSLLGASWAVGDSVAAGAVNVAISVSIALPLGLWAFSFLHRFDAEDPTQPGRRRRPSHQASR